MPARRDARCGTSAGVGARRRARARLDALRLRAAARRARRGRAARLSRSSTSSCRRRRPARACARQSHCLHPVVTQSRRRRRSTPMTSRLICRSLMDASRELTLRLFGELHRLFDVDRHHARHARLLHGDAEQLLGDFHRDLVVADEQELRVLATSSSRGRRSARCCGRRAARRPRRAGRTAPGFSWNIENTSESAVSAFSPPESRWIELFFLPGGWAITCTPASRISSPVSTSRAWPPPNSAGNMRPKWRVDLVERVLQPLARFAVDAPDRVLERRHRLGQVARLRVEIVLALLRASAAPRAPPG